MTTVLIVDDDPQIRQNLLDFFYLEKFIVFEASNGVEALSIMEQNFIDAVIIDVFMPKKDGLETIGEIRRRWPQAKIVVMTGGPEYLSSRGLGADILDAGIGLGAHISLQKPFSLNEAVISVRRLLAA